MSALPPKADIVQRADLQALTERTKKDGYVPAGINADDTVAWITDKQILKLVALDGGHGGGPKKRNGLIRERIAQ